MDDSTLSEYDPVWAQLIPNGVDTSFTDFNSALDAFSTQTNGSSAENRPDLPFSPFPQNPYTDNHRTPGHLSRSHRSSSNSTHVNPSSSSSSSHQPNQIYYEPFPEPLPEPLPEPWPESHNHQPADTSAFDFSFAHAPQPSHPDQSIRLPSINTLTQNLSPVDRPSSRYSWDSAGADSLFTDFWPDLGHTNFDGSLDGNGFVDLTTDSSPQHPAMAPVTRKRGASAMVTPAPASPQPKRSNKRRKLSDPRVKDEGALKVEQIDLMDVEDDSGLSQVLEQQQAAAIKEQQGSRGDEPTKLSSIQCIICMEPMTDMTVTHCGHLFCHTCIMEALIAGENQDEHGKATGKCPVCRKKVCKPKEKSRDRREVIPLEI
ncbi:MAG: hypothetical protein Q9216_006577, partial [Gyalolechia sp. 2 TL-2023]